MAIYTVHAGHAAAGKSFCGAVGLCQESIVDRLIKDSVIKYLKQAGHTVYDCTVDSGTSQSNIISQIKAKINSHSGVTCNVSIHLNASNGQGYGTETLVYANSGAAGTIAGRVNNKIVELGFRNRGVKVRTDLGVLKGITNGGANILVETFFCDNSTDYNLYCKIGADAFGKAIAEGILGAKISTPAPTPASSTSKSTIYRVRKSWADASSQIGAYSNLDNAKAACKTGYSVFDENGKVVYTFTSTPTPAPAPAPAPKPVTPTPTPAPATTPLVSSKTKMQSSVKAVQTWLNTYYGTGLVVDNKYGTNTKKALTKAFQKECGISADGIFGSGSKTAASKHVIKSGSTGIFVTIWQAYLVCNGYNPNGIDGSFGSGCVSATKSFQKNKGLSQDACVGANTWYAALH